MHKRVKPVMIAMICLLFFFFLMGCNKSSEDRIQPSKTPTVGGGVAVTATVSRNACDDFSGTLELQLLVGPAEAVGLEPITIGEVPLTVVPSADIYVVQGEGSLDYEQTLEEEWGSYAVRFEGEVLVSGQCVPGDDHESLSLEVELIGEQMVEVRSEGFSGDYPWVGSHSMEAIIPLIEGASIEGEGWQLILHMNP